MKALCEEWTQFKSIYSLKCCLTVMVTICFHCMEKSSFHILCKYLLLHFTGITEGWKNMRIYNDKILILG